MSGNPAAVPTGRLAPTPSGRLHLGNLFAFLLAWLSVKSAGGRILMRIEDLDPLRSGQPHTDTLLQDLEWLGLNWDGFERLNTPSCQNSPLLPGSPGDASARLGYHANGAYWQQSDRSSLYKDVLAKLLANNLVFPCFCSRSQLHAATAPHASDGNYVYDGCCRNLSPAEIAQQQEKRSPALRARVPDVDISFVDGLQGPYTENLAQACGDFILRRSDGIFAYQLAATADDGAMGINEVVRGRDLLSSTSRQIWLLQTLGYPPPRYFHVPLLLAPDGRRLAKRDASLDMGALRQRFRQPERLVGLLAHLAGLLPKAEPCRAKELIDLFDWKYIHNQDCIIEGYLL